VAWVSPAICELSLGQTVNAKPAITNNNKRWIETVFARERGPGKGIRDFNVELSYLDAIAAAELPDEASTTRLTDSRETSGEYRGPALSGHCSG
jgi:hypothetical protein